LLTPSTNFGDHLSEDRRDLRLGGGRIFDDIVQDRRHQGVGIQSQVGEKYRLRRPGA